MKNLGLILWACLLVAPPLQAQLSDVPVSATRSPSFSSIPLLLSINGGGTVIHDNVNMLPVDGKCTMWAAAYPGYIFVNWQPANVFIFTQITVDAAGKPISTTSTEWSPIPEYQYSPFLNFTEQINNVIFDDPGVEMITEGRGWIANFAPMRR